MLLKNKYGNAIFNVKKQSEIAVLKHKGYTEVEEKKPTPKKKPKTEKE